MTVRFTTTDGALSYIVNDEGEIRIPRGSTLSATALMQAADASHRILNRLANLEDDINIFALLGMRNLSALVGEVYCASVVRVTNPLFRKNPHQDGYPDLLLMDDKGERAWENLKDRLREKDPFSPFPTGGVEVKATCGSVPTPAALAKRGQLKPGIGDQRRDLLTGYDWKAHHRETNHLIGLFWDFIEKMPTVIGIFYSADLEEADWGEIVQPREGGGRTTSVSIMRGPGIRKMFDGWVGVLDDQAYVDFFERRNNGVMQRGH